MKKDTEKTLSVATAGARYFGLCAASSYRAVRAGQIPAIKVGRLWRVPIAAMERMMEQANTITQDKRG
ncbi:helix-turn-helix domain-containing protein [Bradyrhizobium sp. HKCCYLS1011]|uniref:helix-turn-helix domain-containing protein n=1 Tax=Bradyrhizobium sp. HKCCYLS1011 TaxID=3420733 RepID=UPI003EBF2C8D